MNTGASSLRGEPYVGDTPDGKWNAEHEKGQGNDDLDAEDLCLGAMVLTFPCEIPGHSGGDQGCYSPNESNRGCEFKTLRIGVEVKYLKDKGDSKKRQREVGEKHMPVQPVSSGRCLGLVHNHRKKIPRY